MDKSHAIEPSEPLVSPRRGGRKGGIAFPERRSRPRPPLAEIRRGGKLNLLPPIVVTGAVRMVEFLIVALLGFGIYLVYVEHEGGRLHFIYLVAVLTAATANMAILQALNLYQMSSFAAFVRGFTRIVFGWTVVMAGMMALGFFVKVGADFSRVWIASWYASALLALFGERLALSLLAKRWIREGRLYRRAVIVGGGTEAEDLIKALEASANTDIRIVGIFDDRGPDRVSPLVAGYPKLGNIDELVEFARTSRLDLLIVSLPVSAEKRLLQLLEKLWVLPVDIRLSAHTNKLRFRPRAYSYIGNVPFIDISDKPIADWDYVKKWLFDKIVASAGADRARAGDGIDRAGHQAQFQGPGSVPAKAPRLQQRADRRLQVPHHVHRCGGRRSLEARDQGRPPRDPRRPVLAQDEPR